MTEELKKSVKTAALLVSAGLFVSFFAFFLFFGKGLQILIPFILTAAFFLIYLLCEKLSFIREHPFLKTVIALIFIALFIVLL